jgi:hypothetical protein
MSSLVTTEQASKETVVTPTIASAAASATASSGNINGSKTTTNHIEEDAGPEAAVAVAAAAVPPTKQEENDEPPVDLAETLGLKAGDRIEVQWEIHDDNDSNDNNNNNNNDDDDDDDNTDNNVKTVWWKATLNEHDGRTADNVAIRSLHYDPRPDLGFPESSTEDVIFLGHDVLMMPTDPEQTQLHYKREGLTEEENDIYAVCQNEAQLEEQLNQVVMDVLRRNSARWESITPSQRAVIADQMSKMKNKLKTKLTSIMESKSGRVVTSETINEILTQQL